MKGVMFVVHPFPCEKYGLRVVGLFGLLKDCSSLCWHLPGDAEGCF